MDTNYIGLISTAPIFLIALACVISFAWAMKNFFITPTGTNIGIKAIYVFGSISAALQLIVVVVHGCPNTICSIGAFSLFCGSLFLFWTAVMVNRTKPLSFAFSLDLPEHIVVRGPYRYIRHPFYTSYEISWIAGAIATQSAILLIPVVVMGLIYTLAARDEENKFTRSNLGLAYSVYKKRTGMFFPRLFTFESN